MNIDLRSLTTRLIDTYLFCRLIVTPHGFVPGVNGSDVVSVDVLHATENDKHCIVIYVKYLRIICNGLIYFRVCG